MRPCRRRLRLGDPGPLRRPIDRRGRRLWSPETSANGWFACPDNSAVDAAGTAVGCNRPGRALGREDGQSRRTLCARDRGRPAAYRQALLPLPGRCRDVRPLFHSRPGDAVPGGAASRRRRHGQIQGLRANFDVRGSRHPLAGFRSRHAAAALGARHHQARRRQNRLTASPSSPRLLKKPALRAS